MHITQIKETCLYSTRLEETKAFYTEHLELPVYQYLPGKHLFLRAGSSMLLFFNPEDSSLKETPPPHFASGQMHIAFEVPGNEYEAAKQKLISSGVEVIYEETWPGDNRSFYFNDPNRHVLEIVTPGLWN